MAKHTLNPRYEVEQMFSGVWLVRVRASNGKVYLSSTSQGYSSRSAAIRAAKAMNKHVSANRLAIHVFNDDETIRVIFPDA